MVCHLALSSLSIILCFLSLMSPSPPPSCHVLFYFATIRGTNEKQEGEEESLGGWCPHIITTPSNRPLSISALHLSVLLSDSWQLVGYSGHASIPRCMHLPTDLRKKNTSSCVWHCYIWVAVASRSSHYCPPSMVAIKTCNSTSTENESSGTHSGMRPHHKNKHLSRGPFSRSLKNNYMWTDSKFWWTFPIRKIKTDKMTRPQFWHLLCCSTVSGFHKHQRSAGTNLSRFKQ